MAKRKQKRKVAEPAVAKKQTRAVKGLLQEIALADPSRLFADGTMRYNPSILVTRKGFKIFDKMKKDDQIKAALAFKKHAVLSSGWEVKSPADKPEDWEVKEFVKKVLNELEDTLYETLYSILSSLEYGFSVSEKIYEEKDNKLVLKRIKNLKPHSFEFVSDEYGNLIELKQLSFSDGIGGFFGTNGKPLPVDKFVIFTNQKEFGNHYGSSDLEAAYRPWLIKDNSYKWLAMSLERRGLPPLFALYNSNAYQGALISDLKDVMTNLQASTVGVVPRTSPDDLDFYEPKTITDTKNIFAGCIQLFNQDITRALLMPGLLGMSDDNKQGSLARSKVHFDAFIMIITYLRSRIEDRVMNEQIIIPLVDLNFAGVTEYPVFKFLPMAEENQAELLRQWTEMIKIGALPVTDDDEAHVRDVIKFPEREFGPEGTEVRTPNQPQDTQDTQDNGPDNNTPPEEPSSKPASLSASVPGSNKEELEFASVERGVNKFEEKIDFAHINNRLDNIELQAQEVLTKLLTSSRDSLVRFYKNNQDTMKEKVKTLKLKNMGKIQETIGEMLRVSFRFGLQEVKKEMSGKRNLDAGMFTPTEALDYFDQKKFWVSGVMKESILKDSKAIIFNAMATGELLAETQQKLNALFEPWVGSEVIKDGKVIKPYRLETIIRTNTTDAFNQGRLSGAREVSKFLHGMEYSAILDARTTEQCSLLDGKIFEMGDPTLSRFTPPLHFNCRSVLVPISKSQKVSQGDFVDPITVGKVNSIVPPGFGGSATGPVPKSALPKSAGKYGDLKHGKIEDLTALSEAEKGVNTSLVADIKDDGKGIYKAASGESSDLVKEVGGNLYRREIAAYRLDNEIFGFDIVPTTVEREIAGEIGSFQAWREGATLAKRLDPELVKEAMLSPDADKMLLFDLVIGNGDRHVGNWMYDALNKKVVAIDNGYTMSMAQPPDFVSYYRWFLGKKRKPHYFSGGTMDDAVVKQFINADSSKLRAILEDTLESDEAIENVMERFQAVKETLRDSFGGFSVPREDFVDEIKHWRL